MGDATPTLMCPTASIRCSAVPTGLGCSCYHLPSVKTLGLVQSSLRDGVTLDPGLLNPMAMPRRRCFILSLLFAALFLFIHPPPRPLAHRPRGMRPTLESS